jgi:peptidoglycan/xylan/chitin deacetylase (PgdA/CDA1 family)
VLRSILREAQQFVPTATGQTWILSYHLVGGGTGLAIDIPRDAFVGHLDLLAEHAEVVALRQLVRELRGVGTRAADGSSVRHGRPRVVLTFDDAFLNFYEKVLPLLIERSLPATLYVPPGFVNGEGNHPLYDPRFLGVRPMTWAQLGEASAAGIELGSHTYRHTNLVRLSDKELADELEKAQTEIDGRLGVRPSSVCYPEAFVTRRVVRAAARFYETGVTAGGKCVAPPAKQDLMRLPRLPVMADTTAPALGAVLCQGIVLEEWAIDRVRRLRGRVVQRA